jgi:flagellar biosynthetic protein FliQ
MEDILHQALSLLLWVSVPLLLALLATAWLVSIFQAATQLLEPTLAFVPKLIVLVLVLLFAGSWMVDHMLEFARETYSQAMDRVE